MNLRRALVFSKTLIALIVGSTGYAVLAHFLDRGPHEMPPATQNSLAQSLERDGVLRSVHHEQEMRLRARETRELRFDFQSESEPGLLIQADLPTHIAADSFVAGKRALEILAPSFRAAWVTPELGPGSGFVLEGRLCWQGTPRTCFELIIREAGILRSSRPARLALGRAGDEGEPNPRVLRAGVDAGEWFEFAVALPGSCRMSNVDQASVVAEIRSNQQGAWKVDTIGMRVATRAEALLLGASDPALHANEATFWLHRDLSAGLRRMQCVVLPPPSTLIFETEVFADAWLQFSTLALAETDCIGLSELTVEIAQEGAFGETLLRTLIHGTSAGGFADVRLDLKRFAGSRVRLQFRVAAIPGAAAPLVALGNPMLSLDRPPGLFERSHQLLLASYRPAAERDATREPFGAWRETALRWSGCVPLHQDPADNVRSMLYALPEELISELHQQSLAQVLAGAGYRSLAVVREEFAGMDMFAEQVQDSPAALEDAGRFLARSPRAPAFLYVQLPEVQPEAALERWVRLFGSQRDTHLLVVVFPERDAQGHGAAALAWSSHWVKKGATIDAPVALLDLAPSCVRWLEPSGVPERPFGVPPDGTWEFPTATPRRPPTPLAALGFGNGSLWLYHGADRCEIPGVAGVLDLRRWLASAQGEIAAQVRNASARWNQQPLPAVHPRTRRIDGQWRVPRWEPTP